MPKTEKQQKAACVAYGIKKKGGTPKVMANMSSDKLRKWCKSKDLHDNISYFKSPLLEKFGRVEPSKTKTKNHYCTTCSKTTSHYSKNDKLVCSNCDTVKIVKENFKSPRNIVKGIHILDSRLTRRFLDI